MDGRLHADQERPPGRVEPVRGMSGPAAMSRPDDRRGVGPGGGRVRPAGRARPLGVPTCLPTPTCGPWSRTPSAARAGQYPPALLDILRDAPPRPWMYTGGLENHPNLIRRMAEVRPLWGNGPNALRRLPVAVHVERILRRGGTAGPGGAGGRRGTAGLLSLAAKAARRGRRGRGSRSPTAARAPPPVDTGPLLSSSSSPARRCRPYSSGPAATCACSG